MQNATHRAVLRLPGTALAVVFTGVLLLVFVAATRSAPTLEASLRETRSALRAREGELTLARLELARLRAIHQQSARHAIPADLAERIHEIAVGEGIHPDLAFALVRVESRFTPRAVSEAGAVGLTQVLPSTAFWLEPELTRSQLFDEQTNLRLGFRYLRQLIGQYGGDVRLALLAYNRGPGRVDEIRRAGGDPANGYARKVLRGGED